ncbi:helix-turn-helix domain-containing protein [Oceanobacillus sojae]|uniref:helix-turn-helix domain-containing protein n=1 Tax=Oceanobacillus sojae TaxID=582851 RepID=UPI000988376D
MTESFKKPKRDYTVPISYKPLHKTLIDKGLTTTQLQKDYGVYGTSAIRKLNHHEPVSLDTIAKICRFLNVPIEEVVEVLPPDKSDE